MSEVKTHEDCDALTEETQEESFSESQDMNRKLSPTAPHTVYDLAAELELEVKKEITKYQDWLPKLHIRARIPSEFVSSKDKSWQQEPRLKEKEFVMINVRTAQGSSGGEVAEKIPKEEAVCRFCFNTFLEAENARKTKCECKFTLIHEACAVEWSQMKGNVIICNACEQDIQMIPVTLCKHMDTNEGELNGDGTKSCSSCFRF